MPKGVPNKRYTPEFKKLVVETMMKEKMSYRETARQFEISNHHRVQDWERIYLTEGPEGFAIACAISYVLSGYCGLYSSQTILYSKLRAEFINVHTKE